MKKMLRIFLATTFVLSLLLLSLIGCSNKHSVGECFIDSEGSVFRITKVREHGYNANVWAKLPEGGNEAEVREMYILFTSNKGPKFNDTFKPMDCLNWMKEK